MRPVSDVINDAIIENRFAERLLYFYSTAILIVGVSILIWGTTNSNIVASIGGFACTNLIWPAMAAARRTRKENIAIRLLEVSLTNAKSEDEAAMMIANTFEKVLGIHHDPRK